MYRFNAFPIQDLLSLLITELSIFKNYSNRRQYVEDFVKNLNLELVLANAVTIDARVIQ
jgi:hypothetical protein